MSSAEMDALQSRLGYRFRAAELLEEALTHPGAAILRNGKPLNYQRLEFLGDAVLGLLIAELLLETFPDENEGSIARRHAALVCSPTLLKIAETLDLSSALNTDGANGSGLDDACEAVLGALYLDGGLEAARRVVREYWEPHAREVTEPPKDAKTALQEWAQGAGHGLPVYRIAEQTGPAHAPQFLCEVEVAGFPVGTGAGSSKRIAEQAAAGAMLKQVQDNFE